MHFIQLTEKSSGYKRLVNLLTDSFEDGEWGVRVRSLGRTAFWFAAAESLAEVKALIRVAGGAIGEIKEETDVVD
jgi:hypothetical protein